MHLVHTFKFIPIHSVCSDPNIIILNSLAWGTRSPSRCLAVRTHNIVMLPEKSSIILGPKQIFRSCHLHPSTSSCAHTQSKQKILLATTPNFLLHLMNLKAIRH